MAGIAGASLLGIHWLDAAAGLLVAVWLLWGAIGGALFVLGLSTFVLRAYLASRHNPNAMAERKLSRNGAMHGDSRL